MSYRIEFLTETTNEESVVHALTARGTNLEEVEREAFAQAETARSQFGATGFQIRHVNAVDEVIAIANFDDEHDVYH